MTNQATTSSLETKLLPEEIMKVKLECLRLANNYPLSDNQVVSKARQMYDFVVEGNPIPAPVADNQ
jgi:hypothetical protein